MFPGRKSALPSRISAGFYREPIKIGPPALRPARRPILRLSRLESGRHSAQKPDFRPGSTIA